MKQKIILTIFSLAMLLIFIVGNVSAALPPPSANFEIDFSELNLPEGNWQLSIISIPAYGTDTNQAKENFNTIKASYLEVKEFCGKADYFELRKNPSLDEVEELKKIYPIVDVSDISKGHYGEFDKLYHFLKDEEHMTCIVPTGYGNYNDLDKILEDNYKKTTNFWIHHYSKGVELKKNGEDIRAFYPTYCEIEDNLCNLRITEGIQEPYFVVLEKMNSNDEIYFFNPININWESSGNVEWKEFEPNTYSLNLNQLDFSDSNSLVVSFEGSKSVELTPEPEPTSNIYYWIIGLVIIIILVVLFFSLKKKK